MAVSYLKKYKNKISREKSILKKNIVKDINMNSRYLYLTNDDYYGLGFDFYIKLKCSDVKVIEERNFIYYGLDLNKAYLSPYDMSSLFNRLMEYGFPRYSYYSSYKKFEEYFSSKGITRSDVEADNSILKNDPIYAKFEDVLSDISSNAKVDVSLMDGEWPRLSDRKLLPLLIINTEKMEYDYYKDRWSSPNSYRQGREKGPWDRITDSDLRTAAGRYLFNLCEIKVTHKDVR